MSSSQRPEWQEYDSEARCLYGPYAVVCAHMGDGSVMVYAWKATGGRDVLVGKRRFAGEDAPEGVMRRAREYAETLVLNQENHGYD